MDRRSFLKRAGASVLAAAIGNNVKRADANKLFYDNTNVKHKNTTMKHKCKITILKRECYKDLQEKYLADPKSGPCPYFREGQVIMVDNDKFFRLLNGTFCAEAWDCISRYVYAALQGGSIMRGWTNDEKGHDNLLQRRDTACNLQVGKNRRGCLKLKITDKGASKLIRQNTFADTFHHPAAPKIPLFFFLTLNSTPKYVNLIFFFDYSTDILYFCTCFNFLLYGIHKN